MSSFLGIPTTKRRNIFFKYVIIIGNFNLKNVSGVILRHKPADLNSEINNNNKVCIANI